MKFPILISASYDRCNQPGIWRDHSSLDNVRKAIARKNIVAIIAINEDGTWDYLDVNKVKSKEILDV